MNIKKRKCKNKGCNNTFHQYNSIQTWCSPKCGAEIAQAKVKANYKAETIVLRNKYYASDIKTRKKAQKAVRGVQALDGPLSVITLIG